MGNICPSSNQEKNGKPAIMKKKNLASSIYGDENGSTGSQRADSHAWSQSGTIIQNSFAKKNEIGIYFCGGSLYEKDALSYPKRSQEFEGIIEKSKKEKQRQKLQSKNKSILDNSGMRKDMDETFHQKFNFLPGLLSVNPKSLSKSIKKGPPIKYRWVSWKSHLYSMSNSLSIEKTRKELEHLQYFSSKEENQIEKDINRTFPSQPYFQSSILQHNALCNDSIIGYLPLKRVLIGISNLYPKLGYCQGMNFILGFILLINGSNEAEAFWMFKILAEHPDFMLMGLYEDELPFLKFLEYLAKDLLKVKLRDLMEYFQEQDIPDSFWLTKWFLTLFLYNFPVKICSRLWDFFITNDVFSLIKLMIPLLDVFKHRFMEKDACSFMECFTEITQDEEELTNPKSEFFFNLTEIIQKADSFKIEKKTIAKYAVEYLGIEPENEYARLYSLYDDEKSFSKAHAQLIKMKVLNVEETFKKLTESDNIANHPEIQTQMIKEVSEEQYSPSQTKDRKQDRSLSNRKTAVGFENATTVVSESDKQKEFTKKDNNTSKIENDVNKNNNDCVNYFPTIKESEEDRCSEAYMNLKEQMEIASKINEQKEKITNQDDSQDQTQAGNESPNKSQIKRTQTKADELRDHLATMEFDVESYNVFQSLANKSPEIIIKKESSGSEKSSFDLVDGKTEKEREKYRMNRLNLVSMSSVSSSNSALPSNQYAAKLFTQSEIDDKSSTKEILNYQIT